MQNTTFNVRRSDAEIRLTELYWLGQNEGNYSVGNIKINMLKSFYEMYDYVEGTHHAEFMQRLYFCKVSELRNFERIAQDLHVDISTLRRYRQMYIKSILYVLNPPSGSCLNRIIESSNLIL